MSALVLLLLTAAPSASGAASAPADVVDFIDSVRPLFQVVTCQAGELPAGLDAKTVASYCDRMRPRFERFQKHWGTTAKDFLATLRPKDLPDEVVYPFGGGDLMSALMTYPDARIITTLSLELAGDPRRLPGLTDAKVLGQSLSALSEASASTLMSNDSLSKNLSAVQRGQLPGQLSMHLMGLALFGFEPVRVRYFRVESDGALHYFTAADISALEAQLAPKLKSNWKDPDFSPAFANVEVEFVPRGQPGAPRRVHRHLAANLHSDDLKLTPGVLKHLEAKGRVAAMTKAASYLLWREGFATIRDYLLAHADFMVSDSTGIPPSFWTKRSCAVAAYGSFQKSFLGTWEGYQEEFRKLFAKAGALPMRYGYPDGSPEKRNHLVVVTCPR
ncbi:MAG: hypothetical protein AB1938_19665 [Myxococcota bacterium]